MTPDELRTIRKALGLTQKQMAERLFLTPEHYNSIERGKNPVTPKNAALARSLLKD